MSKTEDSVRLRHMLDAARKVVQFTKGRRRQDLDNDEMLTLALVRLLEILGEAANAVSTQFQQDHPGDSLATDYRNATPPGPCLLRCRSGHRLDDRFQTSTAFDNPTRTNTCKKSTIMSNLAADIAFPFAKFRGRRHLNAGSRRHAGIRKSFETLFSPVV